MTEIWVQLPVRKNTIFVRAKDIEYIEALKQPDGLYRLEFTLYDKTWWTVNDLSETEADKLLAKLQE